MILAHVLAGPSHDHRMLERILGRAPTWANAIHVVTNTPNSIVNQYNVTVTEHEPFSVGYMREGWEGLRKLATKDDHVGIINQYQTIHDYGIIAGAVRNYPQHVLGFTSYYMQDTFNYCSGSAMPPEHVNVLIPFKDLEYGVEQVPGFPAYAGKLPVVGLPLGDMLDYSYAGLDMCDATEKWCRGGLISV